MFDIFIKRPVLATVISLLILLLGIFPVLVFGVQDAAVSTLMGYLGG